MLDVPGTHSGRAAALPELRPVLIIDPDPSVTLPGVEALRKAGLDAHVAADAEAGLRRLAALSPAIVILELEYPGRDGLWLLRRIRDEYMGPRPCLIVCTRSEALQGQVAELGVDAVAFKPASPETLVPICMAAANQDSRASEAGVLRELIKASVLQGDLGQAFVQLAQRLARCFGVAECIVAASASDRQWLGAARGPVDESPDARIWDLCRVALEVGAPILTKPGPELGEAVVGAYVAAPIESSGGTRLGVILLCDDAPRLFPAELLDSLRTLGHRLYGELAWRSVHDRIAADRDRLRESSMLDPLLGVWNRAALDQALPGEVSACQRRGEPLSLMVVNLRGLRHLNERYGHVVGDLALKHMAQAARGALRSQDVVARYGGDSLALVLPGTPLADARQVAERLVGVIGGAPLAHEGHKIPIEIVLGLAGLAGEDDTAEAAMARAAGAMRTAKRRREPICAADAATPADPLSVQTPSGVVEAGATLGGMYEILHEISRGAMGVVYRAEDLGLGRPVALKTLRPDLARDRSFVERFRAEAATLAAIRHENLVAVYAFGMDGDDVYFVMELVEGEPLDDRIQLAREEGKLVPLELVGRVLCQIAGALDAMHQAGILHRDVKPANVLLDRVRDRAVLVDVGIAKKRGTAHDPAGTPGFTAPESFVGGGEGPPSDVYGLAATAYMLLTTASPFGEGNLDEVLPRQRGQRPEPASKWRPGLTHAVDDVLFKALDPDPGRRYASALEFASALSSALRGQSREEVASDVSLVVPRSGPPPLTVGIGLAIEASFEDRPTGRPGQLPAPAGESDAIVHFRPVRKSGPMSIVPGRESPLRLGLPSLREPEAPESSVPHTRGVLFRSAYRVLGARQGAAWVAHVSRKEPQLAQALQPQTTLLSWHPTELFICMLNAIFESGRDVGAFGRELGRVAASATFSRFFGADPTALTPAEVFSAADLFWRRYHTWGKVAVEAQGAPEALVTEALVTIEGGPGLSLVPSSISICPSTMGILEQVAVMSGAAGTCVEHTACEAMGAKACVFRVFWRAPQGRGDPVG